MENKKIVKIQMRVTLVIVLLQEAKLKSIIRNDVGNYWNYQDAEFCYYLQ